MASVEQAIAEVKQEIASVKKVIAKKEAALEDVKEHDERTLVQQRLTALEQRLAALEQRLQQKELLLMQQQPGTGATASGAAAVAAAAEEDVNMTIRRRLPSSSRHAAHIVAPGHKQAAVVVGKYHVATYAHQDHEDWTLGTTVMVGVHNDSGATRKTVLTVVELKDDNLDIVLLRAAEPLEPAVLSGMLFPGQRYFVLGQSSQAQPDETSVTHGMIAAAELDTRCHVRGDIPVGVGDSGAGAFSVDTGALIGMSVGTDHLTHKAILLPSSVIQSKLPLPALAS